MYLGDERMRLIDAEALKSKCPTNLGAPEWLIDMMPTIDAEPVVRCTDCQHAWGEGHACGKWNALVEPDDFCSAAKVAKTT